MRHGWCRSLATAVVVIAADPASGGDARGGGGDAAVPSAPAPAAPAAAETSTWVLVRPDVVMHLRWDADGANLTGTARIGRRSADGSTVTTESLALRGVANGRHLVLSADERPWSGTVMGDALILSVPRPDGSLEDLILAPGTAEDYDAALRELRGPEPTAATTTTATTSTSTTVAPPPTTAAPPGDARAARRAELAARTARLAELQATDDAVATADDALDEMDAAAAAVNAAGPSCASAGPARSDFERAAARATAAVAAVEDRAAQLRRQSDAVLEAGLAVRADGDPAGNAGIRRANAQLVSADTAASELERYTAQVRAAIAIITARAGC